MFSTKENTPSGSDNEGSYFTQALIQAADEWDKKQNKKSVLSINWAISQANLILLLKNRNQEAVIYTQPNICTELPFTISTKDN